MATVEDHAGRQHTLSADCLVGRAAHAELRVLDSLVSLRHASLRWTGNGWELRDLGSRNGTYLNGARLPSGARAWLQLGAQLAFGGLEQVWDVTDVAPPCAAAIALDGGRSVQANGDLLILASSAEPVLSLVRAEDGSWMAESAERVWSVARGDILVASKRRFRFEPGGEINVTLTAFGRSLRLSSLSLELIRDGHIVRACLVHARGRVPLRPRAHMQLLWVLARQRVEDQLSERGAVASHGWIDQQRVLALLGTSLPRLTVDIYRARQQLKAAGVLDGAQIIQRRLGSQELRIGVERIVVRERNEGLALPVEET